MTFRWACMCLACTTAAICTVERVKLIPLIVNIWFQHWWECLPPFVWVTSWKPALSTQQHYIKLQTWTLLCFFQAGLKNMQPKSGSLLIISESTCCSCLPPVCLTATILHRGSKERQNNNNGGAGLPRLILTTAVELLLDSVGFWSPQSGL